MVYMYVYNVHVVTVLFRPILQPHTVKPQKKFCFVTCPCMHSTPYLEQYEDTVVWPHYMYSCRHYVRPHKKDWMMRQKLVGWKKS